MGIELPLFREKKNNGHEDTIIFEVNGSYRNNFLGNLLEPVPKKFIFSTPASTQSLAPAPKHCLFYFLFFKAYE